MKNLLGCSLIVVTAICGHAVAKSPKRSIQGKV